MNSDVTVKYDMSVRVKDKVDSQGSQRLGRVSHNLGIDKTQVKSHSDLCAKMNKSRFM